MRVCVDASTNSGPYSGTGVFTESLIRALSLNRKVSRLDLMGGEPLPGNIPINFHHFRGETSWHKLIQFHLHANRPKMQAEVSFFPNFFLPHTWPIPSVATIHDVSFISHPQCYNRRMRLFYRNRLRHTVANATHILTVSEASKQALLRYIPDIRRPVTVITQGSRLGPRRYPTDKETPYLLYVGNIEPKKNILAMIEGFLRAGPAGMTLRTAGKLHGTARYCRAFLELVRHYPEVTYEGYVEDHQLSRLMDGCSGLVNLSEIEGFGLPVREAIEKNKPVLISDDPALLELSREELVHTGTADTAQIAGGFRQLQSRIHCDTGATYSRRPGWDDFNARLDEVLTAVRRIYTPALPRITAGFSGLRKAILEGIAYAAVFSAPVSILRLYELLYQIRCTYPQFYRELHQLVQDYPDLIHSDGTHVWLARSRSPEKHHRNAVIPNSTFLEQNRRTVRLLSCLPWIRGLYYSGGSVHGSGLDAKRDIDLFVVARNGRVWLVYTLIRMFAILSNAQTRICSNYLVDEDAMTITYQQDFYTAFEIAHLQPVRDDRDYPCIRKANPWIRELFPNLRVPKNPEPQPAGSRPGLMGCLNLLLMHLWGMRWHSKGLMNLKGGMLWDFRRIKLHTYDNRPAIYRKFRNIMRDLVLATDKRTVHLNGSRQSGDTKVSLQEYQ